MGTGISGHRDYVGIEISGHMDKWAQGKAGKKGHKWA